MNKLTTALLCFCLLLIPSISHAGESFVKGGFEAFGHVVTGIGFEHFSNDPVTEWTNDGTFPGVIGSYIPNVAGGTLPAPGQDNFMFYVDDAELDLVKTFGKNVALRADLEFGRLASGSFWNFNLQQAYMTANIPVGNGIALTLGRFWGQAGFEAFDAYDNEIISWSILSRSGVYPFVFTGCEFRYEFNDLIELYVSIANNMTTDSTAMIDDVPSTAATLRFNWGNEDSESYVMFTPFFGPESGDNRHFTYGFNADFNVYVTDAFAIGGQGVWRRDNGFGGPTTNYAGGLFELYYDFTDAWYGVIRYTYFNQMAAGNGVLNLSGAEQQIHEASLAGGYWLNDACVVKAEARFDYIDPNAAADQWNLGAALAFAYGF